MSRPTARLLVPREERMRAQAFRATRRLTADIPEMDLREGDYVIVDTREMPVAVFRPLDAPSDLMLQRRLYGGDA